MYKFHRNQFSSFGDTIIQKTEFGDLMVPVNNTLVCHASFVFWLLTQGHVSWFMMVPIIFHKLSALKLLKTVSNMLFGNSGNCSSSLSLHIEKLAINIHIYCNWMHYLHLLFWAMVALYLYVSFYLAHLICSLVWL